MQTLLREATPEFDVSDDVLTAENYDMRTVEGRTLLGIGGTALLDDESAGTYTHATDDSGNLIPRHVDLREAEEWVLEPGRPVRNFVQCDVLLALTAAYRKLPPRVREVWSGGDASSHTAMEDLYIGKGLGTFVGHMIPGQALRSVTARVVPGIKYDPTHNGTWT